MVKGTRFWKDAMLFTCFISPVSCNLHLSVAKLWKLPNKSYVCMYVGMYIYVIKKECHGVAHAQ